MTSVLYIDYDNSLKTGTDIRICEKKNFSPMIAHSGLFEDFAAGHVQVLIDFLGSPVWINVARRNIISAEGSITNSYLGRFKPKHPFVSYDTKNKGDTTEE